MGKRPKKPERVKSRHRVQRPFTVRDRQGGEREKKQ